MKFLALVLPLALFCASANADTSIWNNYHGNAGHTGYLNVKTDPAKFKVVWDQEFVPEDEDGAEITFPTITDHLFYVTVKTYHHSNNYGVSGIYALNLETGATVWKNVFTKYIDFWTYSPVYDNGKIYWLSNKIDNATITAVSADTGNLVFAKDITYQSQRDGLFALNAFDHHLYVSDRHQLQYSLNGVTGAVDWFVPAGSTPSYSPISLDAAVTKDFVIRTNYPGIDILNRQTGEKFYIQVEDNTYEHLYESTPVWDEKNKSLYVVTGDIYGARTLTAVDLEQRLVKWKLPLAVNISEPVVTGDAVYVCSDAKLFEVNAITGKINWSKDVPGRVGDMVVTADRIFLGTGSFPGEVVAVSRQAGQNGLHDIVGKFAKNGVLSLDNDHLYIVTFAKGFGIEVMAVNLR